ncbi:hypothetical protein B0H13DRAFT_2554410 [Mycena leptocephala]|nr:hypothetical protein B0H13DRAFT_2554410 [Mycena leptocephala]
MTQILTAVVPHRARWEHLDFYLPPSYLSIIDGPMPLLRHLHLALSEYSATNVLAFRDAPVLRSVILNDTSLKVILPWAQLTSLTLLCVYPHKCVPFLQKTLNLVHCELEICYDSDDDEPGPDVTLPCLESLTLVDVADGPVTGFLETFIVPALRGLKVPEDFINPNPIESLTGFISKSGCKLEELHIDGLRSLPRQSYRKAFPVIHKFSFDDEEDSSESDALDIKDNSVSE